MNSGEISNRPLGRILAVFLLSLAMVFPVIAQTVASRDFEKDGFGDWYNQGAELATSPDGGHYAHLDNPGGKMVRFGTPTLQTQSKKSIQVKCRYRSSVPSSSRDVGSWVSISFVDNKGQGVGLEAIICPPAPNWTSISQRFDVPAQANRVSVQFRVQTTKGTADFDDIQVDLDDAKEPVAESAAVAAITSMESGWNVMAHFQLKGSGPSAVLTDGKAELKNLNAANAATGIFSFQLPEQYLSNDRLAYDVQIVFTPSWGNQDGKPHGLFQVGRNIHGVEPNSMAMMLYNAKDFITRLTASNGAMKTDVWTRNLTIVPGTAYKARAIFTKNKIVSFWNDRCVGETEMATQTAIWPKDKPMYVGGESAGLSPLQGQIQSFSLRVLSPKLEAVWASRSPLPGYFFDKEPRVMQVDFPNGDGESIHTQWSVRDVDGKSIIENAPATRKVSANHQFQLPDLEPGWYCLTARVQKENASQDLTTGLAIVASRPDRVPADDSPWGITQELNLRPGQFDPVFAKALFERSKAMGVRWWRLWLSWDYIEHTEKGKYDWANLDQVVQLARDYGLELYVCIQGGKKPWQSVSHQLSQPVSWPLMTPECYMPADMDAWSEYLTALATRYRGLIRHYQIWNESDARNGLYPFKAEEYVRLLKASAEAIRRVDPTCKIGLSGFAAAFAMLNKTSHTDSDSAWGLGEFYRLNPQPWYDIMDCHFYSVSEPSQSWDGVSRTAATLRQFMNSQGDAGKPIWNSETSMISGQEGVQGGWSMTPLVSPKRQAARVVQFHVQSQAVSVERSFWYLVTGECGLVETDLSPKPAFVAHAMMVNRLQGWKYSRSLDIGHNLRAYEFSSHAGKQIVVWTQSGEELIRCRTEQGSLMAWDTFGRPLAGSESRELILTATDWPVYIQSLDRIDVSSMIQAEVDGMPVAGQPIHVRLKVMNSSQQASTCHVAATLGKNPTIRESQEIKANGQWNPVLTIPSGTGMLRLEVVLKGGTNQQAIIEKQISPRQVLGLSDSQALTISIDRADQIKIGAEVKDNQGRVAVPCQWSGVSDLSGTVHLTRDGDRIRFRIDVRDNEITPAVLGKGLYEGDAVEIFLDFNSRDGKDRHLCHQLIIAPDGRMMASDHRQPAGFEYSATRIESGYRIEGSFRLANLHAESFGFDVALDDADGHSGRKVQMVFAGDQENHVRSDRFAWMKLKP